MVSTDEREAVSLEGAVLKSADLRGAILKGADLSGAVYDTDTSWRKVTMHRLLGLFLIRTY